MPRSSRSPCGTCCTKKETEEQGGCRAEPRFNPRWVCPPHHTTSWPTSCTQEPWTQFETKDTGTGLEEELHTQHPHPSPPHPHPGLLRLYWTKKKLNLKMQEGVLHSPLASSSRRRFSGKSQTHQVLMLRTYNWKVLAFDLYFFFHRQKERNRWINGNR